MAGFDDPGVFFSDNFNAQENDEQQVTNLQIKNRFREFIRRFYETFERGYNYKYRDQLKKNYNLRKYFLQVDLDDLAHFDAELSELVRTKPSLHLPLFEDAAKEIADEVTKPRPEGEEDVQDIQITLASSALPSSVRDLKSDQLSQLIKIPGIIIAASSARAKATRISIQCRNCKNFLNNIPVKPGLEGYAMPRKCPTDQAGRIKCPVDPFFIVPEKCKCVDYQLLKLQEAPETLPKGEMPRHLQLYCDRYLCDSVVPGNRVSIIGIYSIKKVGMGGGKKGGGREKSNAGVRMPYVRVLGVEVSASGPGRFGFGGSLSVSDEDEFHQLAASPDIYKMISSSIAPSIFGCDDIKKAIACLLFGGSRKRLPDGLTRRGDINLLLLGDPGTAKSQLLKFIENCAPIGVYTSGKGSSAAGLTASVIRDPSSRNFVMEGGAMVLADGGVVCIDEFDKMREDDRVAIHEAMEQQTISIAKAGITTTLNSRCSVLAAANGVHGRWDDSKGAENIDFMPTILSRFDMIFIVKDEHDETRDATIARHIMKLHMNAFQQTQETQQGQLTMDVLKKYITYCRNKCGPRLSVEAAEKLKNKYIQMRNGALEQEKETGQQGAIPITVRQLEAVIRISESLAKMRLSPFATDVDVDEALRLFQVSTLDAAMTGQLSDAEGFSTKEDQEVLYRIERQLKKRFVVGSQVSEHAIIQDFIKQNYPERSILKVMQLMLRRGELQYRMQRKMLYRFK